MVVDLPRRKSMRLSDYDYSQEGAYFITICTHNRIGIFDIETFVGNDLCAVPPNESEGNKIIHKWIRETENKFTNIRIDKYVIMPNHIDYL